MATDNKGEKKNHDEEALLNGLEMFIQSLGKINQLVAFKKYIGENKKIRRRAEKEQDLYLLVNQRTYFQQPSNLARNSAL